MTCYFSKHAIHNPVAVQGSWRRALYTENGAKLMQQVEVGVIIFTGWISLTKPEEGVWKQPEVKLFLASPVAVIIIGSILPPAGEVMTCVIYLY